LVKISNLINKIHAEEKSLSGINSNLENLTKILEEAKNSQETNISDESEKLNKIKNDIKIMVGMNFRYRPDVMLLKSIMLIII